MPSKDSSDKLDRIVAQARREREDREKGVLIVNREML